MRCNKRVRCSAALGISLTLSNDRSKVRCVRLLLRNFGRWCVARSLLVQSSLFSPISRILLLSYRLSRFSSLFLVTRPWILGFNQEPVDTRFANSRAAVLNCSTKAEPAANVTWRYASGDQQLITTNTTLRYVLPNGSLYFPSFPKEKFDPSVHEAAYQCLAENKAGVVVSRTARLRAGGLGRALYRTLVHVWRQRWQWWCLDG